MDDTVNQESNPYLTYQTRGSTTEPERRYEIRLPPSYDYPEPDCRIPGIARERGTMQSCKRLSPGRVRKRQERRKQARQSRRKQRKRVG